MRAKIQTSLLPTTIVICAYICMLHIQIDFEPDESPCDPEVWAFDDSDGEECLASHDEPQSQDGQAHLLQLQISIFLLLWKSLFKISGSAVVILLKFLRYLFQHIGELFACRQLNQIASLLPCTIQTLEKLANIHQQKYKSFVMCKKCSCIYKWEEAYTENTSGIRQTEHCTYVSYPRHPQQRFRTPCNEPLLREVLLSKGKRALRPFKQFCYHSVIDSLKHLVQQPGILEQLNTWRTRRVGQGILNDVYDGKIWKDFQNVDGAPFLSDENNVCLGLIMNVDWFQPFDATNYSVGVIYLSVLNLPREIRYKLRNIIVCCIIPGPSEPRNMNPILDPLVEELQQLWKGVEVDLTRAGRKTLRAALLCNSCDLPASRKVAGFVGHNALRGCTKCLKVFPTQAFGEKTFYGGFDRESWSPRTLEDHTQAVWKHKAAKTAAEGHKIEREHGVKYSVLSGLRLPYYNPIRQTVVDPMHNLFTGTAHKVLATWKEKRILTDDHFGSIQRLVDSFCVPKDIGRIPHKIASGFSGFKSDQWRSWTIIYSLVVLKPILPPQHYQMWRKYVEAVYLICRQSVSLVDLDKADALLVNFCKEFESLFGSQECTINMHLHCHLKECIMDYGPPYAFWVYAFERCNGYLGQYPNNRKSIEFQLMAHFQKEQQLCTLNLPQTLTDLLSTRHGDESTHANESCTIPPYQQIAITLEEQHMIKLAVLEDETIPRPIAQINRLCLTAHRCKHHNRLLYISDLKNPKQMLCISIPSEDGVQMAVVQNIYQVNYHTSNDKECSVIVLRVWLLKKHGNKDYYGACVQVWSEDVSRTCYITLAQIVCFCAFVKVNNLNIDNPDNPHCGYAVIPLMQSTVCIL